MVCISQAGKIPHELLCSSIELFSNEVLPEFKERELAGARQKAEVRARISEKAMSHKPAVEAAKERTIIRAAGHHLGSIFVTLILERRKGNMKMMHFNVTRAFALGTILLTAAAGSAFAQGRGPGGPGLTLTSPDFEDGGVIPNKYTQAVPNPVSPELTWSHVPAGTVTFALLMHDPDVAMGKKTDDVTHWMAFNIPGTATELAGGPISRSEAGRRHDSDHEHGPESRFHGTGRGCGRSVSSLHV